MFLLIYTTSGKLVVYIVSCVREYLHIRALGLGKQPPFCCYCCETLLKTFKNKLKVISGMFVRFATLLLLLLANAVWKCVVCYQSLVVFHMYKAPYIIRAVGIGPYTISLCSLFVGVSNVHYHNIFYVLCELNVDIIY